MASNAAAKAGTVLAVVLLAGILAVSIVILVRVYDIKANQSSTSESCPNLANVTILPPTVASSKSTNAGAATTVTTTSVPSDTSSSQNPATLPKSTSSPSQTSTCSPNPAVPSPSPTASLPNTNINPPAIGNSSKYEQAAAFFKRNIDTSVNPCDNFFKYACGRYNGSNSIEVATLENYAKMAAAYIKTNANDPLPVKQVKQMYTQCVADRNKWDVITANGTILKNKMNDFLFLTDAKFPLIDNSIPVWPNSVTLGLTLGTLSTVFQVNTLITPSVDTNWREPEGNHPYLLYLDQPSLSLSWTYYIGKTWNITKPQQTKHVQNIFEAYAAILKVKPDAAQLSQDAVDVVEFERLLATKYMTDDKTRWNSARSYNLVNVGEFSQKFSFLDWPAFATRLAEYSSADVQTHMKNSTFQFDLMEPQRLMALSQSFQDGFANTAVTARTLYNYFAFRLLDANSQYFPVEHRVHKSPFLSYFELQKPAIGRPTFVRPKLSKAKADAPSMGCVDDTLNLMPYANARVFVDAEYPQTADRDRLRSTVRQVVEGILIGMQSMIDQLSWMTPTSKAGAYAKIQNLVRNVAYPDFITDDEALTQAYAGLTLTSAQSYPAMLDALAVFSKYQTFALLTASGGTHRDDWNGAPGIVNAWYQPQLNSISFPIGILRQPFFDIDWPAALNFGGVGMISGHELTHGFDSSGTQWNGFGKLTTWLDASSQVAFDNMTECVILEYDDFCPLDSAQYSPNCINGQQTVGENVADNGGIHASFRAYRNALNLHGAEPHLPGDLVGQFSHDQLFFLAYGNLWCAAPPDPAQEYIQLLVDPHSPGIYRVLGTIQNFPAFRNAFNCPIGSNSAPEHHCNVWVSDIDINDAPPAPNSINVPAPAVLSDPNDPSFATYGAFEELLTASLNLSSDPCNDFYGYACGSISSSQDIVDRQQIENIELVTGVVEQLLKSNSTETDPTAGSSVAVQKAVTLYKTCKSFYTNLPSALNGSEPVTRAIKAFSTYTGLKFNWFDTSTAAMPTPKQLAKALAYLSIVASVNTFVTPFADVNGQHDAQMTAYSLFLDENVVSFPAELYQEANWNDTKHLLTMSILEELSAYATSIQAPQMPSGAAIATIVEMEHLMATTMTASITDRQQYGRWLNKFETGKIPYQFVDWPTYVATIGELTKTNFTKGTPVENYLVYVTEPTMFERMATQWSKWDGDIVTKYLFYRLIDANGVFINRGAGTASAHTFFRRRGFDSRWPVVDRENAVNYALTNECSDQIQFSLDFIFGRLLLGTLYPSVDARITLKKFVAELVEVVKRSWMNMLDDVAWLDDASYKAARAKLDGLVVNVAFPDFIFDNAKLDAFHAALTLSGDYADMLGQVTWFRNFLSFNALAKTEMDRDEFLLGPGVVNAIYKAQLNAITLNGGIFRVPYFDRSYPASVLLGFTGAVIGHVMEHAFDDRGVQFDAQGVFVNGTWLTPAATTAFNKMTQCVMEEYNGMTVLPPSFHPNHLDGTRCLGENLADNAGVNAAWLSFQKWTSRKGTEPRLADDLLREFSHEQLFFLTYAQAYCRQPMTDEQIHNQIVLDTHSPDKYRVLGTLQNMPAFRNTFNCPLGSVYAPRKHCSVWVSDS